MPPAREESAPAAGAVAADVDARHVPAELAAAPDGDRHRHLRRSVAAVQLPNTYISPTMTILTHSLPIIS
jgi:hypothetical protein